MLRLSQAADDAAGWLVHPSQTVEHEAEGSLTVRFRAGGFQETCWHLFTWGTAVGIVEPQELRLKLTAMANEVAEHHRS